MHDVLDLQRMLFRGLVGFDAALLCQQGHRTHQVLHADDANYLAAFGDGNQRKPLSART